MFSNDATLKNTKLLPGILVLPRGGPQVRPRCFALVTQEVTGYGGYFGDSRVQCYNAKSEVKKV